MAFVTEALMATENIYRQWSRHDDSLGSFSQVFDEAGQRLPGPYFYADQVKGMLPIVMIAVTTWRGDGDTKRRFEV